MAKTVLAIGAHYDDCVYGIPGLMLQAVRKHYRVVILSVIGDHSNAANLKGRQKEINNGVIALAREYGAEMRFLNFVSHRFEVTDDVKRAIAEVVADVQPEIGFTLWMRDRHHDHEVASITSQVALQHGDRVLDKEGFKSPRAVYLYDNGPGHTIGFEPNTYVDVTTEWPTAIEWLGRLMALQRGQPYNRAELDAAQRSKETIARYRGLACGASYAEALWALTPRKQDILT